MKPELTIIPTIAVHPHQINVYSQIHWDPVRPNRDQQEIDFNKSENDQTDGATNQSSLPENFKGHNRSANGIVSEHARRKIGKAVDYLLLMSNPKKVSSRTTGRSFQFKIAFVTLTLPSKQVHSDNEIKSKCLNSLLLELKKYYHVRNYVWRAEKQENGNLHFHIIVDRFIPWHELRNRWNRIVEKLGYVTRYREELKAWHAGGFKVREDLLKKWSYKKQIKAYETGKANDWNSPNSTDIHSISKVLNIKAYVTKYMIKNPADAGTNNEITRENIEQSGRIWGCNTNLSKIKGAQTEIDNCIDDELQKLEQSGKVRIYRSTYFTVINVNFEMLPTLGATEIYQEFCRYLSDEFGYNHQPFLAPE